MSPTTTGWMIFIAAVGMMCSLLAVDVAKLSQWADVWKPEFIAVILAHMGTVIMAFIGGKLIPPDREPNQRRNDDPPS